MNIEAEIFKGNRLADQETLLWRGRPGWFGFALDAYQLRAISLYFSVIVVLNGYEAWAKKMTLASALHGSVPLVAALAIALGILSGLAWLTARSTCYTITDRRVILHYGIAMPATLSLPYRQIVRASITIKKNHSGDIPLVLESGNHMAYLKLWPFARPWTLAHPEPMLRRVPEAALVGGILARAIAAAALEARAGRRETSKAFSPAKADRQMSPELVTA